jgi:hypothetical protein
MVYLEHCYMCDIIRTIHLQCLRSIRAILDFNRMPLDGPSYEDRTGSIVRRAILYLMRHIIFFLLIKINSQSFLKLRVRLLH